ncbi:hypothetical protein [Rhizobium leguminosarum]|uniref:hypothetical protein n=1 Tax=Rhizobium leguminosarum TaxID=384 RepID=UPI0021BBF9E7|nr:hypothetical protein [Rhizobium leguminosarum]
MTMSVRSLQINFFEISEDFRPLSSEAHPVRTSPAPKQTLPKPYVEKVRRSKLVRFAGREAR